MFISCPLVLSLEKVVKLNLIGTSSPVDCHGIVKITFALKFFIIYSLK